MNKHERQYCVTRKELLAVVEALKAFHSYLYDQMVLLSTDNASISWIKNLKNPPGQTTRWLQEIETYDLIITHRAGKRHSNADALSRRPCRSCERQELKNTEDDSNDDVDQTNLDLKVCAITRSETKTDTIVPESGVVLDGGSWTQSDKNNLMTKIFHLYLLPENPIIPILIGTKSHKDMEC